MVFLCFFFIVWSWLFFFITAVCVNVYERAINYQVHILLWSQEGRKETSSLSLGCALWSCPFWREFFFSISWVGDVKDSTLDGVGETLGGSQYLRAGVEINMAPFFWAFLVVVSTLLCGHSVVEAVCFVCLVTSVFHFIVSNWNNFGRQFIIRTACFFNFNYILFFY